LNSSPGAKHLKSHCHYKYRLAKWPSPSGVAHSSTPQIW